MQLRNKILLIFVVIVAFFTIPSFAGTNLPTDYTSLTSAEDRLSYIKALPCYDAQYENLKYIVLWHTEGTIYLMESDYPIKVDEVGSTAVYLSGVGSIIVRQFYLNGSTWYVYPVEYSYSEYTRFYAGPDTRYDYSGTLSTNHDLVYVDTGEVAISLDSLEYAFPNITPTLAETLEAGYQVAKETTSLAMTAQLVELIPAGVAILATMILVSLIAYFPHWKA